MRQRGRRKGALRKEILNLSWQALPMPSVPSNPANLAALLQSQNLATLLATLNNSSAFTAGKTVEARLTSLDSDGTATAIVNGIKVALVLAGPEAKQAALQPGASLILKLAAPAEPGAPLQATLVGTRPAPAVADEPAPAANAGQQPAIVASPRQPAAAGAATLATAQTNSLRPAQAEVPTSQPAVPVPTTAPSPRAVAGPLLGSALGRQDSLAPLFANLGGLAQGSVALVLPKPLMTLVDQILAQRLPTAASKPLTAEALKDAVARSGLFLEARQAAGEAPTPQTDLKAGLLALRDMLKPAVEGASPPRPALPTEAGEGAAPAPAPASRLPGAAAYEHESAPPAATQSRLPPPRDGLLTPQPVQERSLGDAARPAAIAQTLFEQAEAGLDRIALAQYASLPQDGPRLDHQPQARWLTEIPLALPNGTAVMPLEIERDPPQPGSATPDAPIWRVRFALDAEPLGALQGVVTLQGRALGVSFWAEREETSRLLRQATPDLETALLRSRFESADFEVFTGHPRQARAAAGQFLDRRS
jgi:hypothetical protein